MIISQWLNTVQTSIFSNWHVPRTAKKRKQPAQCLTSNEQLEVRSMLSAGGLSVASIQHHKQSASGKQTHQAAGRDEVVEEAKKGKGTKGTKGTTPSGSTQQTPTTPSSGTTIPTTGNKTQQSTSKPGKTTATSPGRGISSTPKPGVNSSPALQNRYSDDNEIDPNQKAYQEKLKQLNDYYKLKALQQQLNQTTPTPEPEPEVSQPGWNPLIINREHYTPWDYRYKSGPNIDNPSTPDDYYNNNYNPPSSMDPSTWQFDQNGFTPGFFENLGPNFNQPTPTPYYPDNYLRHGGEMMIETPYGTGYDGGEYNYGTGGDGSHNDDYFGGSPDYGSGSGYPDYGSGGGYIGSESGNGPRHDDYAPGKPGTH